MGSRTFCDRQVCGKEIEGVPFRIILPGQKNKDLCEKDKADLLAWLNNDSRSVLIEAKKE